MSQPPMAEMKDCGLSDGGFLPALAPAVLRQTPCFRVSQFFPDEVAQDLHQELRHGLEYERVELADVTWQWRARRPLGDVYFGRMERKSGWQTPESVEAALELFESAAFLSWLSNLAGEEIEFRRPVTAYWMERSDRLCLHDDMSDPSHAVSVAYNLTPDWQPEWGGETRYGEVTSVVPLETPADSPIDLQQWNITNEQRFTPEFNSLLIMRLDTKYAHGVAEVTTDQPRLALVGIYARRS